MIGLRWGWILLGGFLVELAIFAITIPVSLLVGQQSLLYSAPLASFVAPLVIGYVVAQKTPNRQVLHGTLVGLVAVLIYVSMSLARPEPIAYVFAHLLKLLGGALGGYTALKRGPGNAIAGSHTI
jgi:putative membrane protein (TIGR04086 family)